MAEALVRGLESEGLDVLYDRDDLQNVASQPEWMARAIERYTTICLLTDSYVEAIAHGDESAAHQGTIFETRAVLSKLYYHTKLHDCPVIPVAAPDFCANKAPHVLNRLMISRFDWETGEGLAQIVGRVRNLPGQEGTYGAPSDPAASTTEEAPRSGQRKIRDIILDLERALPSDPGSIEFVREWVKFVDKEALSSEFVEGFAPAERIIKSSGHSDLMHDVADRCLEFINGTNLLDSERRTRAMVLICGRAWALCLQRDLDAALKATEEGIQVASECGDRWLLALGKRCLAYIHRELAEETEGDECESHVRRAIEFADAARRIFESVDHQSREIGSSLHVLAHVYFTKHRLLGDREARWTAASVADKAVKRFPILEVKEYYALQLLRAEISVASGRLETAEEFLDKVTAFLEEREAAGYRYRDYYARVLLARAELRYRRDRRPSGAAKREAAMALEIFDELKMRHSGAICRWFILTLDPGSMGLARADVKILGRLCPEPHARMRAVKEHQRRAAERTRRCWRRKGEWRDIVTQIRRHT